MPDDPPNQIKPYLDEIAGRLWSDSATVMVGAGFSRNAEPVGASSGSLPDWRGLGDLFYKRLHGRPPGEEERYLSLPKLAEQVEAAFGRPALNDLLSRAIPDLRYEPSPLHSSLLELPWKDVFTTNFDTLLERARAYVPLRHYGMVVGHEDLLYANTPRIVKLHGSFPSPPFVITEEDYRRYPSDNAPFVNTVRQSLLENTLCLVGFSGDDPNFLQWIGWIRDHIGKENAPKLYLVGVLDELSTAEWKLLDRRGIVTVNLSVWSKNHGDALSKFFRHLRGVRPRTLDWPAPASGVDPPEPGQDNPEKYAAAVTEWRGQRESYPGWIVVPEDRREALWWSTHRWIGHLAQISPSAQASLETPLDLDLAFELAWRLDRCLFPLEGKLPEFLEEVAAKYGDDGLFPPDHDRWTYDSVFEAVANIRLWLLRHYRQEGRSSDWERVKESVEQRTEELLPEQRARFRLEEAWQALFQLDPGKARKLLMDWQASEHLPFWEAKRAALMAELGDAATALPILEASLLAIRKQIGIDTASDDLALVSQESIVMLLLRSVERHMPRAEPDSDGDIPQVAFSERRKELAKYKCDPWREIESFSLRLSHARTQGGEENTTHQFDLGHVLKTVSLGPNREVVAAYGLLRLLEDLGMPYRTEGMSFFSKPVSATLALVGPYSSHWALVSIARLGDARVVDRLFDREFLQGLGQQEIDGYFDTYLDAFDQAVAAVNDPNWSEGKPFAMLTETLPEVFSRLCYKCSPLYRERLAGTLMAIYRSKNRRAFGDAGRFGKRLLHSMSISERIRAVPNLLAIPVPDNYNNLLDKRYFPNPILWIDLPRDMSAEEIAVEEETVDGLLECYSGGGPGRDWAATSLAWLHEWGLLKEPQLDRFGNLLWERMGEDDVPEVPGFYSFICRKLPHPLDLDPVPRLKKQWRARLADQLEDSRLEECLEELRHSAGLIEWSEAETWELFQVLCGWWNKCKERLSYQGPFLFSPAEMTRRGAGRAVDALSALFLRLPGCKDADIRLKELGDFVADLRTHNIPATRLEAASEDLRTANRADVLHGVAKGLLESDRDEVLDALDATSVLMRKLPQGSRAELEVVLTKLMQGVEWRHRVALAERLRFVTVLVGEQPWVLSESGEKSLLDGLAHIAEDTSGALKGNDSDGQIPVRAAAAALAFAMFRHYEAAVTEAPETILRWRDISRGLDEFAEVRNAWEEAGG